MIGQLKNRVLYTGKVYELLEKTVDDKLQKEAHFVRNEIMGFVDAGAVVEADKVNPIYLDKIHGAVKVVDPQNNKAILGPIAKKGAKK